MHAPSRLTSTPQASPGDIVACSGTGWVSWAIRLGTCSPYSHVGIVVRWRRRLFVVESTTLAARPCEISGKPTRGVQAHELEHWLAGYRGRVWLLRLAHGWELDAEESINLTNEALSWIGRGYDAVGALGSAPRCIDGIITRYCAGREGRERAFCSRLVVRLLKSKGVRRFDGASHSGMWNPAEVVRHLVWTEKYLPPERIK